MNGFSMANVRERSTPWSRSEMRPLSACPAATGTRPRARDDELVGPARAVAEGVAGRVPAVEGRPVEVLEDDRDARWVVVARGRG